MIVTSAHPPHRRVRVLLIEDNEGFAYFVRDVLTRQQIGRFALDAVGDLASGLAFLKRGNIDVVLLDLGLPDSGGFRTFKSVRACDPDAPIVIITCLDDKDLAVQAVREGAQDYLVKDKVDAELLVRSIRYTIERAEADRALRRLSARLLRTQDDERRRIARSLHDTAGQTLAAVIMNLGSLGRWTADWPPEARALLRETVDYAKHCGDELRTMSYLLHPPLLDELGLAGSVREYADGFARRSGIRVDLEISDALPPLPREHATVLFRSMQEALTNVHRHSRSPTASIHLREAGGEVRMEIADRGCGIPAQPARAGNGREGGLGVGIAGMRERLHLLGGRLEIDSDGTGTRVAAVLPLPGEA